MKTKAPRFELPKKWQTLDRLSSYETSAWYITPEVWPHGVIFTVEGDGGDPSDAPSVKVEVQVRRDETKGALRGPELHYRLAPDGPWVSRYAAQRSFKWAGSDLHAEHVKAIDEAIEREFKKARSRWLKAQRKSGAEQEVRRQEYEAAREEEDRLRGRVEEAFNESAAWCAKVAGGSEDDEEWRQFWHAVDRLGVVVAKARAAIKARQRAAGRVK